MEEKKAIKLFNRIGISVLYNPMSERDLKIAAIINDLEWALVDMIKQYAPENRDNCFGTDFLSCNADAFHLLGELKIMNITHDVEGTRVVTGTLNEPWDIGWM